MYVYVCAYIYIYIYMHRFLDKRIRTYNLNKIAYDLFIFIDSEITDM